MSVEITEFVDANISISPTGVGLGSFGILGFLTNESGILPVERARAYSSLEEVLGDFNSTTEVYKAAVAFYSQTPQPTDFVVMSVYETAQPSIILGGDSGTLAEIITVPLQDLAVEIDGVLYTASCDFTGVTDLDDVATAVTLGLTNAGAGASVVWNGTQFVLTTSGTGTWDGVLGSIVQYAVGDLSDLLGFSQHQAAISLGLDAESPVEALTQIAQKSIDYTALVTHKKYRDQVNQTAGYNVEDIADFCEASKKIFMNTTNNLSSVSSAITTDIGSVLKAKTLRYSMTTIAKNVNQYPSASIFGRAASVNFEGINTTITLNLKQMPTITAEDFTTGELAILRDKRINAVVKIGKSVTAFTDSRMANGSWLDSVHGLLWLENRIEVDMFNLLYVTTTKIPYTQLGIDILVETLQRSLEAGVTNGLIASGFLPSGEYLVDGYKVEYVPLADTASSDVSNRLYRGLKFTAVGAGAIHAVLIDGTFSE